MAEKKLLNMTDFGKLVGVSRQRIATAIKTGKISCEEIDGKKMIDPKVGQREWKNNLDPTAKLKNPSGKKKVKVNDTYEGMTTADADRKERFYKAEQAKIKYEQAAGQLVEVAKVQKTAFELARKTRDAIMSIPAKVAHEVAVETEPRQVEIMLNNYLAEALESLAQGEKWTKTNT